MRYLVIQDGALHIEHGPLALDDLQRIVDGNIEPAFTVTSCERPGHAVTGYVNEDGLARSDFAPNVWNGSQCYVGPMVITGLNTDTGESCELSDREISQISVCRTSDGRDQLRVEDPDAPAMPRADTPRETLLQALQRAGVRVVRHGALFAVAVTPAALDVVERFAPVTGLVIEAPDGAKFMAFPADTRAA